VTSVDKTGDKYAYYSHCKEKDIEDRIFFDWWCGNDRKRAI